MHEECVFVYVASRWWIESLNAKSRVVRVREILIYVHTIFGGFTVA